MRRIFNLFRNICFIIRKGALPGSLVIVRRGMRRHDRGLFLLIKSRHSGAVTFPSGSLNPFEDFFEAAIRELFEETGLKIGRNFLLLTPLIHDFKYKNLPFQIRSYQRVFLILLAPETNYPLNPQDEDIEWAGWYSLNKTISLLSYPELKLTFKKTIKHLKKM